MTRLWSDRWAEAKSSVLDRRPIARIPWSAIRRIGQSRLLSLTIVVPFLGSMILFNQAVVDVLMLSPEMVRRWFPVDGPPEQLRAVAHNLTLSRLYYVYFGLSFLGFGSSLFALFCPTIVKDYSSAASFQAAEMNVATKPRVHIMMADAARKAYFWDWDWHEEDDVVSFKSSQLVRRAGLPEDFRALFHQVVREVYAEWCRRNPNLQDDDDHHEMYHDVRGIPHARKIGRAIAYPRHRPETFFADEMFDASYESGTRADVLALAYLAQDNTKPVLRLWTVIFYIVGFGLLLIPTGKTFYSVLRSIVA
ncbi:hypothetical protein [Bradyrhizobium liaoningense]|uniref:hypothetical protein n=1 Tax=Bradyrhizobium liaoningense TaxID=43992 RepID=UPI001BA594BB|nr:hypothetical protein [Bradyrhizobium liaoningense]MBR1170502.1 hypothetical protein [Bradyrhizobium liaoningense]